jgi:hypothetical protein
MTVSSVSAASAKELVDLMWELTCAAGIVVKLAEVSTDRGVERCVSARCVEGEHAFMLVPRSRERVEVWWGEEDDSLHRVGVASGLQQILRIAVEASADRQSLDPED